MATETADAIRDRGWKFAAIGDVVGAQNELLEKGYTRPQIREACGFSKSTYDRLKSISDGNETQRTRSVYYGQVHQWLMGVQKLGARLDVDWRKLIDFVGIAAPTANRGRVTLVQKYVGYGMQEAAGQAFYREATRYGWDCEYRSCVNQPGAVGRAIAESAVAGELIVDLPDDAAARAIADALHKGRTVVSTGWLDLPEAVLRVRSSAESYAGLIATAVSREKVSVGRRVAFLSDEHTSRRHLRALHSRLDEVSEVVVDRALDLASEVEGYVAQLQELAQTGDSVALLPIEEDRTQALLLALERVGWPPTLLLFSSHMTSTWLRVFDCRPTWRLAVLVDLEFIVEVGCAIVQARLAGSAALPKSTNTWTVERYALTREVREEHRALSLPQLTELLSKPQRDDYARNHPYLPIARRRH